MTHDAGFRTIHDPPDLMTAGEAACFLRLVAADEDPEKCGPGRMDRLVKKGVVRPCLTGNRRRYSIYELRRLIADETARWAE